MENKSTNYYGLLFGCPVGNEMRTCCFKEIRKYPLTEKINFYELMTEPEKLELIGKHRHCLSVRDKKTLFHESQ